MHGLNTLFLLFLTLSIAISCQVDSQSGVDSVSANEKDTTAFLDQTESLDVRMQVIQDGALKVILTATSAISHHSDSLNHTDLVGPISFFVLDSSADTTIKGRSKMGIYEDNQARFTLIDSVFIFTDTNRRLFTPDTLIWDQQMDRIFSEGFTLVVTPDDSITGYGLDSNMELTEYIFKKISGQVKIDD